MNHSDLAGAALLRLREAIHKPARNSSTPELSAAPEDAALSGATFLEQEPDLAKEAGQHARESSAWAAGGDPGAE